MTTNTVRESAKIYKFPPRGRFAATSVASPQSNSASLPKVAIGSSWYHDEAIREAEQARKPQ